MPPTKLPTATDFPPALHPILHHTPNPINAVIFLPGLGDTSQNFSSFARALNLPETLCVTIQGLTPLPLPLPQGFHWGDDLMVDQSSGDLDPDAGFSRAASLLATEVIESLLITKCGFRAREIMLFGSGQGGMAAIATARVHKDELGGIISIGGPIPISSMLVNGPQNKTPVLLLGGSKGMLSPGSVKTTRGAFVYVEHQQWKKTDDSMPKNRDEALPMMQFFARRLRSRKGVPEGSVELS